MNSILDGGLDDLWDTQSDEFLPEIEISAKRRGKWHSRFPSWIYPLSSSAGKDICLKSKFQAKRRSW